MAGFDPIQYKKTTKKQWDSAADAWHRWGRFLNQWLGESTELMLDMGGIQSGSRVLDVAAGAGEQSITAAKRVGVDGAVLATDLSAKILEFAQASASREGISNLLTKRIDGEHLSELDEPAFDAVISRVGLIYFPDQNKALKGMRDKLRKGGKISVMVYATAEENRFFSIPVKIIRKRAGLPAPLPG
ncbi:MAG: class I SAM-dependent methyltransferase, partial [bacterium]